MRKNKSVILAAALAISMLSACATSQNSSGSSAADASAAQSAESSATSGEKKTLKFGGYGYANTLDPSDQTNAAWDVMRMGVSESLFRYADDMTVEYQLCDSHEVSDDHLTWTFHIKDGVKFSNGNDVTPEAIKACWELYYANTEGSTKPAKFMDYESITADNAARTLQIVLKKPQADLRKNLAHPAFGILDVSGDYDLDFAPVGTGPYAIKTYEPKVSASLVKNEHYWNGDVPFDNLEILYIQEDSANTKSMALEAGDVNVVENITSTEDIKRFKEDTEHYNFSQNQGVRTGFAYMNVDRILKDEVLRQAIIMSVDNETVCNITIGGLYTPGFAVLPSGLAYKYDELNDPFAYNKEAAIKLLDDAGYVDSDGDGIREKDGKNIVLDYITYDNRRLSDFAQATQATLTEIGIGVNLNITDSDTEWNMMVNGEYDLCDSNWTTVANGDPTDFLANWYGSASEEADANYCNYKNPEYDKLFESLATEFDEAKRVDIIKQMQQILIDDAAVLVHGYYNSSMTSDKSVENARIYTADYYWITSKIKPAQ